PLGLGLRRDQLVREPEQGVPRRLAALRLGLGARDGPQRLPVDARQPHGALAARPAALVLRQRAQCSGAGWAGGRSGDPGHLGRRPGEQVTWNTTHHTRGKRMKVSIVLGLVLLALQTRGIAGDAASRRPLAGAPAQKPGGFTGEKTSWHGFDRYDFLMDRVDRTLKPIKAAPDERNGIKGQVKGQLRCVVVVPKPAAPGRPWSWRGYYFD